MRHTWGIYLAGTSYPADAHIEAEVARQVAPAFRRWDSQQSLLDRSGGNRQEVDVHRRLNNLQGVLSDDHATRDLVVFGRSSGARIATALAGLRPIKAVICLGYPFRYPNGPLEPERYAHLARIKTPTLILQGASDVYGGSSLRHNYPLSHQVRLAFFDCGHEFELGPHDWNSVGDLILGFLASLQK